MSFEVDPAPRSSRMTGSASVPIAPGDRNASCESQEGIDIVGSDPTTTTSNVPSSCEPSTTRWHLTGKTGVGTYTDLPKNRPSPALTRHTGRRQAAASGAHFRRGGASVSCRESATSLHPTAASPLGPYRRLGARSKMLRMARPQPSVGRSTYILVSDVRTLRNEATRRAGGLGSGRGKQEKLISVSEFHQGRRLETRGARGSGTSSNAT
ncbi:hypothetical protein LXA43DRAFT_494575 [Ganoderma leucocontextum]|nr:hypothetical protein LXA43DRAFT_494575 [Ganoderma leucocontextum]